MVTNWGTIRNGVFYQVTAIDWENGTALLAGLKSPKQLAKMKLLPSVNLQDKEGTELFVGDIVFTKNDQYVYIFLDMKEVVHAYSVGAHEVSLTVIKTGTKVGNKFTKTGNELLKKVERESL